jgi:FixJ family two-component response regulator
MAMTLSERVLVVDDDALMRAILTRILHSAGLQVQTFDSAAKLLSEADLEKPGVLLLDINMPEMSGLALQSTLNARGISLPIVFLTGVSDVGIAVAAMRNGAVDFVEKPFDSEDLVFRVKRAMEDSLPAKLQPNLREDVVSRLKLLTPRERQVFDCMVMGKTNKMIARDLGSSFRTVEIHRARVMRKMSAQNIADLVRMTFDADENPNPKT